MTRKATARKKKSFGSTQIIRTLERNHVQLRSFGVKKIGLFGSCLKNTPHHAGDMDFIVRLRKPTFDSYMDLKFFLEKTFHKKVDVVMDGSIKPALHYIKKEAKYVKGL